MTRFGVMLSTTTPTTMMMLLYMAAVAHACPFDAPCDCSPAFGLATFLRSCAADEPGGAGACSAALVHAGINTTVLVNVRTTCGEFRWCDRLASASCTTFTSTNKEFTARFCTGMCRISVLPVVSLSLAAAIALVVFCIICTRIIAWSWPTPSIARFRRQRAHAALHATYGGNYDFVDTEDHDSAADRTTDVAKMLRDPLLQ